MCLFISPLVKLIVLCVPKHGKFISTDEMEEKYAKYKRLEHAYAGMIKLYEASKSV